MKSKRIRNDLILIISLLAVFAISLTVIYLTRTNANLIAKIYVQNQMVKKVSLDNNQTFTINGTNGELTIEVLNNKIGVTKSNCPHQDCVQIGFISESNKPIICAYNAVYIQVEGSFVNDVEI